MFHRWCVSPTHALCASLLIASTGLLPYRTHAQSLTDRVWTITDLTPRGTCIDFWSDHDNRTGKTTVPRQEPCMAGSIVQWDHVTLTKAIAMHWPYLLGNPSEDEMMRFVLTVFPHQARVDVRAATGLVRPNSSCTGITYHATQQYSIFKVNGAYTGYVTTDQAYTYNAPCLVKYALNDTVSYSSGVSSWKSGSGQLQDANTGQSLANDGDRGCHSTTPSEVASFSGFTINASHSVMDQFSLFNNSNCSGGLQDYAYTPVW